MAVAALKKEQVARIILTRPAVEAGEALGFLPGDLEQKITARICDRFMMHCAICLSRKKWSGRLRGKSSK